jgi:glycosyltransferase involved in cell wall biosynthesis
MVSSFSTRTSSPISSSLAGTNPGDMPVVLDARVVCGTGGGPDKTILNSPRFFEDMGYRNLCAYLHPPNDPGFETLRRKAEAWGAPLIAIPDRGPLDWRIVPQMLDVCRRANVAIWHGHDYKSNFIGLILRRFWPMRLVTTVHGWVKHTRRTPLYYAIDRACLPRYESVICVSEDLYGLCLKYGVPQDRCVLIENAIDTNQFRRSTDVATVKRRLGIPAERCVIGAVGRLSEEKGFDVLIQSVDQLLKLGLDVELRIVGEGDQDKSLQYLISSLGREDRIRLMGYQAETIRFYEGIDVLALSSYREGLPNVLLEAMALEVPVVATRVAGIPRLIEHNVNGLLVEAGSVSDLTGALAKLVRNSDARECLGVAGRATIEKDHSFEVRIQKIRNIYDKLLCHNHQLQDRYRPAVTS